MRATFRLLSIFFRGHTARYVRLHRHLSPGAFFSGEKSQSIRTRTFVARLRFDVKNGKMKNKIYKSTYTQTVVHTPIEKN